MLRKTICIFCLLYFSQVTGQNSSYCEELNAVVDLVKTSHYQPKPINDSLSKAVFNLFLKNIDNKQRYFLKTDIDKLKVDEYKIDDYILELDCGFIDKYITVFQKRLDETKEILTALKDINLNYTGGDSLYYFNDKKSRYFKTKAERSSYWSRDIRYKILKNIVDTDSVWRQIKKNFNLLESRTKNKIIDNELCLINEIEQQHNSLKRSIEIQFFNAYLNYQDPNSSYLSSSQKTTFENTLSESQHSFGIYTQKENNGEIVISYVIPGSPAYKNESIDVKDKILALTTKNSTLETYCVSNSSVTDFMNDKNHNEMVFKIQKQNGQIKDVSLTKSQISNETNSITGYILEGDDKIGYVNIPSFYRDNESIHGLGVANDVAKQIYKLKREKINALIIDLRANGGGSMKESADLAGMFIDRGPVAITKHRNVENYTIRDPHRGLIYSKPIVVLVSQFSASASELFTAVLQDYNSAIVVGSPTHGKATSQVILPVKTASSNNFVKLTVGEFFRVDGRSHQNTGVMPDINLPSIYDGVKTQEAYKEFSIPNSKTTITLKHKPKDKLDVDNLKMLSRIRVENKPVFQNIIKINTTFNDVYINKTGSYPLTLEYVFEDRKRYNNLWKTYEDMMSIDNKYMSVKNTESTNQILSYSKLREEINQKNREQILKDPYIHEAYNIACDLINL
ncbi:MAG: hypothetical protein KGY51_11920 [Psychroflexus sp.]|nr:hypothetical protein [Psychroflexus sp.]